MVLDALDALVARGAVDIQYLEPLSDDEVQVMARSSGAHAVAERLGAAEGVPLYVEELMDAPVGESVPRSMLESVRQRVNALGADAVRLLGGAALLGRRFDWQLLARGLGYDDHTLVATLRAAATVGLLDVGVWRSDSGMPSLVTRSWAISLGRTASSWRRLFTANLCSIIVSYRDR